MNPHEFKMVVIIDYNMGNVGSVKKAFEKIGAEVTLSADKTAIKKATHLVLPGVGAFADGMRNLKEKNLIDVMAHEVLKRKKPFLGICLGMQLLADRGHEFGTHEGLGWIPGEVVKLNPPSPLRLPHIGWNDIFVRKNNDLFVNIPDNNFYFVHSYHLKPKDENIVSSTCAYGENFVSSISKDTLFAVQFHPEKSQTAGLQVLKNFLYA